MLAWNSLPVDISLVDSKESFTKTAKDTVHNPYIYRYCKISMYDDMYQVYCIISSHLISFHITPFLYYISSKRLYFSLSIDIQHIIIIYVSNKNYLKNVFFPFYFLNTDIFVTMNSVSLIFDIYVFKIF